MVKKFVACFILAALVFTASPAAAHQPHPKSNSVSRGVYHTVGNDWKVKTVDRWRVSSDRWGARPSSGYDFMVVRVRAKKITNGEGDAYMDLNYDLLGAATSRLYSSLGDCSPRDWIGDEDPVYRDGTVTANVCFEVRENDRGFRLKVEHWWDGGPVWYRIQ